jgi:hypothetical protein
MSCSGENKYAAIRASSKASSPVLTYPNIEAPCSKLQGIFDPQGSTIYSNRSLTPQQATGIALAPGFKSSQAVE